MVVKKKKKCKKLFLFSNKITFLISTYNKNKKFGLTEAKVVKKKKHQEHDIEACSNETLLAMRKPYCDNLPY